MAYTCKETFLEWKYLFKKILAAKTEVSVDITFLGNDYIVSILHSVAISLQHKSYTVMESLAVELFSATTLTCVFMISSSHVMCGKEG